MDRRILMSGLLTGALASTATAQAATPAMDMPPSGLSDAVKTHIGDTLAAGALSLMLSRVALTKLRHPMGRQFADFEAAEQDGIADVLRAA